MIRGHQRKRLSPSSPAEGRLLLAARCDTGGIKDGAGMAAMYFEGVYLQS